jgi:signal transduction histidine kinase
MVEFGGRVEISASRALASLYIKDDGCGIPARELDQVTLPFFTRKQGREGLGLTLAARLLEMHGGSLRIESQEGWGTKITILLPLENGRDMLCAERADRSER